MPERVAPLSERQLLPGLIELQKAAAVLHRRVQLLSIGRAWVAGGLAIAGLVAVVLHSSGPVLSIAGLAWTLIGIALFGPLVSSQHDMAVVAQEMFDTTLYKLPWNSGIAGHQIPEHEIHGLARRLRAGGARERYILEGWYLDTRGVPYPYDVLLCQYENLGWDTRLRRRYRTILIAGLLIWAGGGIIVGASINLTVQVVLLQWYMPSLPAASIALDVAVRQGNSLSIRNRLLQIVISDIAPREAGRITPEPETLARHVRDIQDGIFLARLLGTRVPHIIYTLFRRSDERDFQSTAETYRSKLRALSK
jgi:hypothetical protein